MDLERKKLAMSPLAGPVIAAIFSNTDTAGEAAASIVKAVLESNNNIIKGKITSITPQQVHSSPNVRSCRIDVMVKTDQNEYILVEIQVNPDKHIVLRNLFNTSHVIVSTSRPGDDIPAMAKRMPRIIHINILAYNLRDDNKDLVQPFEIMYTKEPLRQVIDNFSGYNVQLPRVLEMAPDFADPLYCWCYILYKSHIENITLQEVINMTPAIEAFAAKNDGYRQFCQQYDLIATSQEAWDEYFAWINYHMRVEGELEWARDTGLKLGLERGLEQGLEQGREEGREEGVARGIITCMEKGRIESQIEITLSLLALGLPIPDISKVTRLTEEAIKELKKM